MRFFTVHTQEIFAMSPGKIQRKGPLHWRGFLILLFSAVVWLTAGRESLAAVGDTRAGIYVGTTTFTAGGGTTSGVTFGGNYGWEFISDLVLDFGLAFSATDGTETVSDVEYDLTTSTTEMRIGLTRYFNQGSSSLIIPFAGGGLSLLNYDIDHTGLELGKTSGTGPGAYVMGGVHFRFSRQITLILRLGGQVHQLKSETGESVNAVSGGLTFSVRISG